jgi:hypothetical protein
MRISMVIPYYGALPKWLPLFVQSAARNERVHFFIATDENLPAALPPNVSHVPVTLAEIEMRVRNLVSPDFRFSCGYKLCDVKPFYGIVFEDLFRDSDFWGYCDLDLVFGDLSPLLDSGRLEEADFFWADAGPVVGTFCLYRNTRLVNAFGLSLPESVRKLNSPEYESLDEKELDKALARATGIRCIRAEKLTESQLSISAEGRMIGRTRGVEGDPDEFYWADGHTFVKASGRQPQEVMYLHFIGLKRAYHWADYNSLEVYNEYGFSAAGFQPWRTPPTMPAAARLKARTVMLRSLSWARGQVAARLSTSFRHKLKSWF